MPGEASDVGSGIGLDAKTGRASQLARPTYLTLLSAAPTDVSTLATLAELAVAGYARQVVTWTAPALVGGVPESHNGVTVVFGPFVGDPPNITHCALVSASSGTVGDFILWWALDVAKDPAPGESIQFAAGNLSIKED